MAGARTVFTIGVYGASQETFYDALDAAAIDVFVDIRRRRAVRGARYAFANATRLTAALASRGIAYRHVLDLAPDIVTLKLQHDADARAKRLLSQRTTLAPEYLARYVPLVLDRFDFGALARELHAFRAPVLFCIERIPTACHRSLVAPRLAAALGTAEVVHLIPDASTPPDAAPSPGG